MDEVKKIKLDSLQSASSTSSSDILPIVQTNENNRRVTRKVSPDVLGSYVNTAKEYPTLQTTNKSIVGAINELSSGSGGASALEDLTDVNISSPTDGQVIKYDSDLDKWVNADDEGGGSADEITFTDTEVAFDANNVQEAFEAIIKRISLNNYNNLSPEEKNNGTIYFITDADVPYPSANYIRYNNAASGLSATTTQAAIDELVTKFNNLSGIGVIATTVAITTAEYTEVPL